MSRGWLGVCAGALALLFVLAAWWLWSSAPDELAHQPPSTPLVVDGARETAASSTPSGAATPRADPEPLAQPFPALAAAPESSASDAALRVRVLRPDGRPALLARVVLFDASEAVVGEGDVDEFGIWTDPGLDGPASLLVLGVTAGLERFELARGRGDHELRLPAGESLHGRVLVDGAPPGKRFVVELLGARLGEPTSTYWWERPRPFGVDGEPALAVEYGVRTDARGHFELSGLVAGEALEFRAPGAFRWDADASTAQPVHPPADEVLIALRSPARLRGRLVDLEGRGVAAAAVELSVTNTLGKLDDRGAVGRLVEHHPAPHRLEVDELGRFEFPLEDHGRERTPAWRLVARGFDVVGRAFDGRYVQVSAPISELTHDHDLGDLVLQDDPAWVLDVVDEGGGAIAGATVHPVGASTQAPARSEVWVRPRDTDVRGRVRVPASDVRDGALTITAEGFLPRRFELPEEYVATPLVVTLPADTTLRVIAHGPWDAPVVEAGWSFRFRLEGADPLRYDPSLGVDPTSELYHQRLMLRQAVERERVALRHMPWQALQHPAGALQQGSTRPEWSLEHLLARGPLTLRVGLAGVPASEGLCPEAWIVEQELWLEPGESRVVHVDLSGWAAAR